VVAQLALVVHQLPLVAQLALVVQELPLVVVQLALVVQELPLVVVQVALVVYQLALVVQLARGLKISILAVDLTSVLTKLRWNKCGSKWPPKSILPSQ
jgi:hypothetical protein